MMAGTQQLPDLSPVLSRSGTAAPADLRLVRHYPRYVLGAVPQAIRSCGRAPRSRMASRDAFGAETRRVSRARLIDAANFAGRSGTRLRTVAHQDPFDLGAQLSRQPCCFCESQCLAHRLAEGRDARVARAVQEGVPSH